MSSSGKKTRSGKKRKRESGASASRKPFPSMWVVVVFLWIGLLLLAHQAARLAGLTRKEVSPASHEEAATTGNDAPGVVVRHHIPMAGENSKTPAPAMKPPVRVASVVMPPSGRKKHSRGRVSIIIDDMGRDLEMAKKFLDLPIPLAFAVLPYEPHTREVAEMVRKRGRVLLLHMPMEPKGYPKVNPGPGALLLRQSPEEQHRLFLQALKRVPGAVGVNNHMGSRFTENEEAMRRFLGWVKDEGLFFIDSRTTSSSVACRVASEVGVLCFNRGVFLDHRRDWPFFREQLKVLLKLAENGQNVIAIGHPYIETYNRLRNLDKIFAESNINITSLLAVAL